MSDDENGELLQRQKNDLHSPVTTQQKTKRRLPDTNDDENDALLAKPQNNNVLQLSTQKSTQEHRGLPGLLHPWAFTTLRQRCLRKPVVISVLVLCILIALAVLYLQQISRTNCDDWTLPTLGDSMGPSLCENCRLSFSWAQEAGISDSFYKACTVAQVTSTS
jgi:hypothetical protein